MRKLGDLLRFWVADRVIAISARTRRDLVDLLGVPESRIDLVPNGVDVSGLAACSEPGDPTLGPYALYVGNYGDPRKNLPAILRSLAVAREKEPLRLLLAGVVDEAARSMLATLSTELGVADAVQPLGYVEEARLRRLYRGARALLFLSAEEGFGYPVVEAMALGCPVIVQSDSGCEELCAGAGVVVAPDDARAAAQALIELGDPTHRERSIAAGRTRAHEYDQTRMAAGTVAAYRRALARTAPE